MTRHLKQSATTPPQEHKSALEASNEASEQRLSSCQAESDSCKADSKAAQDKVSKLKEQQAAMRAEAVSIPWGRANSTGAAWVVLDKFECQLWR